ncbi:hypothetical protein ACOMHN_017981 [Nucella lapillus]
MAMRRTRSTTSSTSRSSSTTLLAYSPQKTVDRKVPEEHRWSLRSSLMTEAAFGSGEPVTSGYAGCRQKDAPSHPVLSSGTDKHGDAATCSQTEEKNAATDPLQLQFHRAGRTGTPSTGTADLDTLAGTHYNLRKNKVFPHKTDKPQDFDDMHHNYYSNLFAGGDSEIQTPSSIILRSAHGKTSTEQAAMGHSSRENVFRNSRGESKRNRYHSHSSSRIENLASIQRREPRSTQRENDCRIKIKHGSCLRNRDRSDSELFDLNLPGVETFDYVLRSNCCLLKQKRSLADKLSQGFHRVLRSGGDKLQDVCPPCVQLSPTAGCRSARRVTFLEPELMVQRGEDGEVMEAAPIGLSSGLSLCREGLTPRTEHPAGCADRGLWGHSTTLLCGIVLGLRILFDAWSDHWDLFRAFDLFHNRSSAK